MDGNVSEEESVEIQNKVNEENQKKHNSKSTHDTEVTTRRRLHTWGGVEKRDMETPINWEKKRPESIPKVQRTIKKATRPGTKTCQKVLPKTKSMIQVRANYINKNKQVRDKNEERNEESRPLKKMKNDNEISKKKENSNKNNNGDIVGVTNSEKHHKPDENTIRKKSSKNS